MQILLGNRVKLLFRDVCVHVSSTVLVMGLNVMYTYDDATGLKHAGTSICKRCELVGTTSVQPLV